MGRFWSVVVLVLVLLLFGTVAMAAPDVPALGTFMDGPAETLANIPPAIDRPPPQQRVASAVNTAPARDVPLAVPKLTTVEGWKPALSFTGIAAFGGGSTLGGALGFRLWEFDAGNGLWLDAAVVQDGIADVSSFAIGLSTELRGLSAATGNILERGGIMYLPQSNRWQPYLTVLNLSF